MIILPESVLTKRLTRLPLKKSSLIRFEESNIELFVEAAYEDANETADEVIIEKTVIESIIEAGLEAVERIDEEADDAIIDKIAGDEAIHDNTAGGRVEEFTVDPSTEAIIDKIAGGEAIYDKIAEGVVELLVEPSIEAIRGPWNESTRRLTRL